MAEETFESFMRRYGPEDGNYPVVEVGDSIEQWPTVVVRFGDNTAVIQFCGVGADSADSEQHPHLSIDIHAFVAGRVARAGVFGMEEGRRYTTFDGAAPGTSHGWPAVRAASPSSSDIRWISQADHNRHAGIRPADRRRPTRQDGRTPWHVRFAAARHGVHTS